MKNCKRKTKRVNAIASGREEENKRQAQTTEREEENNERDPKFGLSPMDRRRAPAWDLGQHHSVDRYIDESNGEQKDSYLKQYVLMTRVETKTSRESKESYKKKRERSLNQVLVDEKRKIRIEPV